VESSEQITLGAAAIARADPDRVVLELADREVTFEQLDVSANRLAQLLVEEASPDPDLQACIPLLVEDDECMAVAVEAIERAGMVIVAIDPSTPAARVEHIAREVRASLVLSDTEAGSVAGLAVRHPLRDGCDPPSGGVRRPPGRLGSITFTSGSTGLPKGIMKPPRQQEFLGEFYAVTYGLGLPVRLGRLAAGSVAASVPWAQIGAYYGWTTVAYETRRQQVSVGTWLRDARVGVFNAVPTVLRQLFPSLDPGEVIPGVKFFHLFGETTTWDDVRQLRCHFDEDVTILNTYGQGECGTIAISAIGPEWAVEAGRFPVGCPLPGRKVTIVDENGVEVPDGESGEIIFQSMSAPLGYWNEDVAQSKVFFPQPDGSMIVHTGDRARFRPDGMLEHLGRLDHLVKVGGNRVDLAEIEANLADRADVADAVATTLTNDRGEQRIRAFVVPGPSCSIDTLELRNWLAQRLPRFALPDAIEAIGELPRLANGKVDRRALPVPLHDGTEEVE
jgi:acyl-coenzyme A synthetase/AMP-(fatty) acid ligase